MSREDALAALQKLADRSAPTTGRESEYSIVREELDNPSAPTKARSWPDANGNGIPGPDGVRAPAGPLFHFSKLHIPPIPMMPIPRLQVMSPQHDVQALRRAELVNASFEVRVPPFPEFVDTPNVRFTIGRASQAEVEREGSSRSLSGITNRESARILILDSISESQVRSVLWHEVLHVCWGEGVPDGWSGSMFGDTFELEEFIVGGITTTLLYVIRHNQELMDYMLWDE
jgi:hypothetical protein